MILKADLFITTAELSTVPDFLHFRWHPWRQMVTGSRSGLFCPSQTTPSFLCCWLQRTIWFSPLHSRKMCAQDKTVPTNPRIAPEIVKNRENLSFNSCLCFMSSVAPRSLSQVALVLLLLNWFFIASTFLYRIFFIISIFESITYVPFFSHWPLYSPPPL